jgi:hypothetical protein
MRPSDNIGYLIGRTGGRRLLKRPGPLQRHGRNVLRHGEPFFAEHGPRAVFLARGWSACASPRRGSRASTAWTG